MRTPEALIAHPVTGEQEDALKAFMQALRIRFETTTSKSPYNKEFVDMVLQAEDGIKKGKGKSVSSEEFDNLWK